MNKDELKEKQMRSSAARELGKLSYEMALNREKIIDDKLGKTMTFVSIVIALVSFIYKELKIYGEHKVTFNIIAPLSIQGKYIFALVIFMLLSVIILSLVGQYGFKKSYIKIGEDLLKFMDSKSEYYNNEYNVDKMVINQYSNAHKSLLKTLAKKSSILFAAQLIIGIDIMIMIFTIVPIILK